MRALGPYRTGPGDSDRTFSTLDSDANPELRRKEAVVVNPYPSLKQRFLATELVHAIRSACKLKISEPPPKLITARYHDKLVKKLLRFLDTKRKTLCEGILYARIYGYLLTRR